MRAPLLLLTLLAVPSVAGAATPTVKSADGVARIGRSGTWRDAKAGASIAEGEFLALALGAHATVVLGDGTEKILSGRVVISGKRLASPGAVVLLSDAVRNETFARLDVDANESTEAATRGAGEELRVAKRRRALTFMGEDEEAQRAPATPADFAESRLRLDDPLGAIDYAWECIADPDAPPLQRARAHLVLGRLDTVAADFNEARREFDLAVRASDTPAPSAISTRTEALLQRGEMRMQLADDEGASQDFQDVLLLEPEGATAAHAQFFLGVLALAADHPDDARMRFDMLNGYPELARAAAELLKTAR